MSQTGASEKPVPQSAWAPSAEQRTARAFVTLRPLSWVPDATRSRRPVSYWVVWATY